MNLYLYASQEKLALLVFIQFKDSPCAHRTPPTLPAQKVPWVHTRAPQPSWCRTGLGAQGQPAAAAQHTPKAASSPDPAKGVAPPRPLPVLPSLKP